MASATQSDSSGFSLPVVRHFIACERIDTEGSSHCSLFNVIYAVRPSPGAAYPRIHPELCLFAQMTGRGSHVLQIELVFVDDEESTFTTKTVTLDLGDDPLIVHGWPIRLKNVLFERPGLYEFRLLCDGQEIAREPIVLRETS